MDKKTKKIETSNDFGVGYPLNVKVAISDFKTQNYEKISLIEFIKKCRENKKSSFVREYVLDQAFEESFLPWPLDFDKKSEMHLKTYSALGSITIACLHVCALDYLTRNLVENFAIYGQLNKPAVSLFYTRFILHFIALEIICDPHSKQSKLMYRFRRKFYYFFCYMKEMNMSWEKEVKSVLQEVDACIKRNPDFYVDNSFVKECENKCKRYYEWFINHEEKNKQEYKNIITEIYKP